MHDLQNLNEDPERKFQNEVTAAVDDLVYIFIRKQFYVTKSNVLMRQMTTLKKCVESSVP